jgi:hypothetical protein
LSEYEIIKADYERYKNSVTPEILSFPGSIFYHPHFLQVASIQLELQFRPLLFYQQGELCGIANLLAREKLNVKSASIPQFFQYFGLRSIGDRAGLFKAFERELAKIYDLAVLSLTPEESQNDIYSGWKKRKRLTYILRPGRFEIMTESCSRTVKKKVRRALKKGITITKVADFPYGLYSLTFKRRGKRPPAARTRLIAWISALAKSGLAETYLASVGDKQIAFRTQLVWADSAYDWLAGADPAFLDTGVNQLLTLKIGEFLADKGIAHWDLLGGDLAGIGQFKRSFGSLAVPHLQIEKNFTSKGKLYRGLMKLRSKIDG